VAFDHNSPLTTHIFVIGGEPQAHVNFYYNPSRERARGAGPPTRPPDAALDLFVSERLNRVQAGGLVGRVDAEEKADGQREGDCQQD